MRIARFSAATAVSVLALACGRSPVFPGPTLIVQVVDELGGGVRRADVELRGIDDDGQRVLDHAHTDSDGVAVFDFPGAGQYELRARTDLICCLHEGMLAASVTREDELLILETASGPCPTAVPVWCE
jgi:hypothetical protein